MAGQEERYELLERIGAGGMAEVFRARMVGAVGFQKTVAIKRILEDLSSDRDFIHRFIDEAQLTARLQHPNICQVIDFGMMDERYFLAMEYVDGLDVGQTLLRLEEEGRLLSNELCLLVISGTLRGLHYAHQASDEQGNGLGIVHRDVSPQNILLSVNGDIKLTDFGAAKANAAVRRARTHENMALGKLAYMAPEQRMGGAVDHRTDIYGAGILLAEMLEGPAAFRRHAGLSGSDRDQLAAAADGRFPGKLSARVSAIIARCVEEEPDRRFADALSVFSAVDECAQELGPPPQSQSLGNLVHSLMELEERGTHRRDHEREASDETAPLFESPPAPDWPEEPGGLSTAPTELATVPPEPSLSEELVTQVARGSGPPSEELKTEVIRGPRKPVPVPEAKPEETPSEELQTRVARPVPMEELETVVHRSRSRPPPQKKEEAPANTTETGPTARSEFAENDRTDKIDSMEEFLEESPPTARESSPDYIGPAPASAPAPAPPPTLAVAPKAPPEWLKAPEEEQPKRIVAPTVQQAAVGGAADTREADATLPSMTPKPSKPSRPAPGSGPRRRTFRVVIVGLIISIAGMALGAYLVTQWQAEQNRSPWPLESPPVEATPDLAPTAPAATPDAAAVPLGAVSDAGAANISPDSAPGPDTAPGPEAQAAPAPDRPRPPELVERRSAKRPQPPAGRTTQGRARISIMADPPGRAYIDGRLVASRTPVRGHEVTPGSHSVRIVFSSTGASKTRTVNLSADEHKVLRFQGSR